MVGLNFLPAGKRPSFDHSKRVVLLNGRNGSMSFALPMPCVGSWRVFSASADCSIWVDAVSLNAITGAVGVWVGCAMFIAPCSLLSRKGVLRLTWAML